MIERRFFNYSNISNLVKRFSQKLDSSAVVWKAYWRKKSVWMGNDIHT